MRFFLSVFLFFIATNFFAQEKEQDVLTLPEYLAWVIQDHPESKNARLLEEAGNAQWLQAKGILDPVLSSKWKDKFYDGQSYYQRSETQVAFQSPFALGLVAQWDVNSGDYLDPEAYTGKDGLMALGVNLPLLQGLMFDETRLALRRAEQIQAMSVLEKQMALNELLFQSTMLYLDWYIAEERVQLQKEMMDASAVRLGAVRSRFIVGDRPAIDTLEAFAQWQTRNIAWQEAQLFSIKARLAMTAFLPELDDKKNILSLGLTPEKTLATTLPTYSLTMDMQNWLMGHPMVQWYQSKTKVLEWEEKWKREKLKPKLNVEYHLLNKEFTSNGGDFSVQNYRWGVQFAFPLFVRDARGQLQLQRIKQLENENDLSLKTNGLAQKARALEQQERIIADQRMRAMNNSDYYKQLWEAEQERLGMGESSVFMVNQRENIWIDQRIKALEYEQKWIQTKAEICQLTYKPYF